MPTPTIAVLEGDGVGPELIAEIRKTIEVLQRHFDFRWEMATFPCGGEYWLAHREEWPREAREFCFGQADAILFSGVGVPGVELPTGGLAGVGVVFLLRRDLDLYASLRPVQLLAEIPGTPYQPAHVNLHLVREITEGLYTRLGGILEREQKPDLAVDTRVITYRATDRIARFAFQLAEKLWDQGDRRAVTCIDKSNVLSGCQLFRRTVQTVAAQFPKIDLRLAYVDNFALDVLRNPQTYSVCVTSNAFGDILADLLAFLEGGNGMAAIGNFGDRKAMFEPLHGSQVGLKGKGTINPVAIHRCLAMLLAWLGERFSAPSLLSASTELMKAICKVLTEGKVRTLDLGGGSTTSDMSEAIRRKVTGRG